MSDEAVTKLLTAIGIAAFRRAPDGSFSPVTPPPRWFERLVADTTFPFLGHILEEAMVFWQGGAPGLREWGPSVEVDEAGHEFHYRVLAVTVDDSQFLLFRLDPGSDRLREVLQTVREQALANSAPDAQARLSQVQHEVRRTTDRIHEHLRPLLATGLRDPQFELWKTITALCEALTSTVDALVSAEAPPPRSHP